MQISALLAATPSCICHINLDKPVPPAEQDLAPQTPALAGRKGRRQRRQKRHQMQDSKPGENFRVWRMSEPCLALTYTAPSAALMVRGKLACSVCALQALYCSLFQLDVYLICTRGPSFSAMCSAGGACLVRSPQLPSSTSLQTSLWHLGISRYPLQVVHFIGTI